MDAGSATGGRAAGRHGRRVPEGSAPRGRDWAVRGRPRRGRPADQTPHPRPGRPSRGKSGRAARRHYRLIAPGSRGHGVQRPAANGRAAMAATEGKGVSVEVARRPQGPGCGFCEDPSALRDARCQPLPEAAAAAALPLPRSSSTRHPLRNDSAAARGLLGNGVQSSVHAAGLCPTRNYNSQASTLLKVSPRSPFRSPFPVPCAFGILESPPLKTAG